MKGTLKFAGAAVLACSVMFCGAAEPVTVRIHDANDNHPVIPREIYGQFAEHLGTCIYGGGRTRVADP